MFADPFYHSLLRKYTIIFGSLFNDISLQRYDDAGNYQDTIRVPLMYGPRQRFIERLQNDPELSKPTAIRYPRMSFNRVGFFYDSERKLLDSGRIRSRDTSSTKRTEAVWNPVPYNIDFELYIAAKSVEDLDQIVEQILPYFTPEWHVTANLLPSIDNTQYDIPIVLSSVNTEDTFEGGYDDQRTLMFTMNFTLKGYLFGPIRKKAVIKLANTNFYVPNTNTASQGVGNTTASSRVTVTPGLTSDGQPTSNASASIDRSLIDFDDNYGYIVSIEFLEH